MSEEEGLIDINQKISDQSITQKFERKVVNNIPTLQTRRKPQKGEIVVEFDYVEPNEAYYHTIKALLVQYLDGEEAEELDLMGLADHICERASIGTVVVSPLDPENDPEQIPELQKLSDADFEKAAVKYNAKRDVFGFSTILSLNYKIRKGDTSLAFLCQIRSYVLSKCEKHGNKAANENFKNILSKNNVGLLMCERLINMPSQVIPALHSELPEDLQFTRKCEEIKDPKEFDYSHLLVISK